MHDPKDDIGHFDGSTSDYGVKKFNNAGADTLYRLYKGVSRSTKRILLSFLLFVLFALLLLGIVVNILNR